VLTVTPNEWHWTLTAFLLFRLFDIWKPYPIRQLDKRFKNGLGVMLDDLLAAVYTMLSVQLLMQISHVSA
jgi:phosphatidylglycerophosphatase A